MNKSKQAVESSMSVRGDKFHHTRYTNGSSFRFVLFFFFFSFFKQYKLGIRSRYWQENEL